MKTGEPGGQEGLLSLAQQPHHLLLSIIDGPAGKGELPGSGEGMLEAEAVMSRPESPIRSHASIQGLLVYSNGSPRGSQV